MEGVRDELTRRVEEVMSISTKEMSLSDELEQKESSYQTALQDIQSLKFQLSTEEMKSDGLIKDISEAVKAKEAAQKLLDDSKKSYIELGTNINVEKDNWTIQKENLLQQCELLNKQCDNAKGKHNVAEKEVIFLKVEISKLAKEKDDEKAESIELRNKMEECKQKE